MLYMVNIKISSWENKYVIVRNFVFGSKSLLVHLRVFRCVEDKSSKIL
jgi:hypothetical protein